MKGWNEPCDHSWKEINGTWFCGYCYETRGEDPHIRRVSSVHVTTASYPMGEFDPPLPKHIRQHMVENTDTSDIFFLEWEDDDWGDEED